MSQYTPREYANMHFIYGECKGNASAAAKLYRERYPNVRHPDYRVFIGVHSAYCEGRIPGHGVGGRGEAGRQRRYDEIVLNEIEADPSASTRAIARRIGIGRTTVHRIVKDMRTNSID